jgi:hypothetical protein
MPAPYFGEPGYIFGQNTKRVIQQANDLQYCGEFSNINSDRVWAAWTPPALRWITSTGPAGPAEVDYPEEGIIAIGDRQAEDNFEWLRRFGIFHQNAATMPPEYSPPSGPVAELPERKPPPLPRPRPAERILVSALVDAEEREIMRAQFDAAVREECAARPFEGVFFSLQAMVSGGTRCAMFWRDWY